MLTSRSRDAAHAWRIEVDAGEVGMPQPAALAAGTTVTVQELYFNTPARRKFLRTRRDRIRALRRSVPARRAVAPE